MHAIVLKRFGPPEVLESDDIDAPTMRADQMLIKVAACGVCGHDLLNRAGSFGGTRLPAVMGHEIAGVIERTGSLIKRFKAGDRVALLQRQSCGHCPVCIEGRENLCRSGDGFYGEETLGGYGSYVVASQRNAVLLPSELPFDVGCILSCALGTGFHALGRARVRAGDSVIITGASGGVGVHTVQIARMMGLFTVAVTTSKDKSSALRSAGADEVLVTDAGGFHDQARTLLGDGATAVIEIAGAPTFNSSVRSLRPGGRLVFVGNVQPGNVAVNPAVSILKEIELIGSAHAVAADLRHVVDLVQRGRLRPIIDSVMPVNEAAQAHRILERRATVGRIVLSHA